MYLSKLFHVFFKIISIIFSNLLRVFAKGAEEGWAGGGHRLVLHGQLRQPHEVLEQEERSHVSCAWEQSLSFDCAETNTIDGDNYWSLHF